MLLTCYTCTCYICMYIYIYLHCAPWSYPFNIVLQILQADCMMFGMGVPCKKITYLVKRNRREKRVTDKSHIASLRKVTQFHVGEILNSFRMGCFLWQTRVKKAPKRVKKAWTNCVKHDKLCVLPFQHFAHFLRINTLRAGNPKPKVEWHWWQSHEKARFYLKGQVLQKIAGTLAF
jgi:hypothetical protein